MDGCGPISPRIQIALAGAFADSAGSFQRISFSRSSTDCTLGASDLKIRARGAVEYLVMMDYDGVIAINSKKWQVRKAFELFSY